MVNLFKNKDLVAKMPSKGANLSQNKFDFAIHASAEVDGIGMGVLTDGTPFLTGRGLASLCGVSPKQIQGIGYEWLSEVQSPRVTKLKELLGQRGLRLREPYVAVTKPGFADFHAYPDTLCLAVLEYYAFEAGANIKDAAVQNFRRLAGQALRDFIYKEVGYTGAPVIEPTWKPFHDRISMVHNSVPVGYFGVFHAIADIFVALGEGGVFTDSSFIPDGSVGSHWSKHWVRIDGDNQFGCRIHYPHSYPPDFPQAMSNPQEAWAYPEMSLGEFHRWRREDYVGKGALKTYLTSKERQKGLPVGFAEKAVAALSPPAPRTLG